MKVELIKDHKINGITKKKGLVIGVTNGNGEILIKKKVAIKHGEVKIYKKVEEETPEVKEEKPKKKDK
jgi:hypothetical protein